MENKEYPVYYQAYIQKVPQGELIDLFQLNLSESLKSLAMISEDQSEKAYATGKWNVKEIVQHLIDAERIFCFRALAFARGEQNELAGYDHEAYQNNSLATCREFKQLLEEWRRLRYSTIDLFSSFDEEMLERKGVSNQQELSVRQIGFVIIGHAMHHLQIIDEKY